MATHSFTCKQAIPAFTPQPQSITAFWLVLILPSTEGRRLSQPGWLVTYRNKVTNKFEFEFNIRSERWAWLGPHNRSRHRQRNTRYSTYIIYTYMSRQQQFRSLDHSALVICIQVHNKDHPKALRYGESWLTSALAKAIYAVVARRYSLSRLQPLLADSRNILPM